MAELTHLKQKQRIYKWGLLSVLGTILFVTGNFEGALKDYLQLYLNEVWKALALRNDLQKEFDLNSTRLINLCYRLCYVGISLLIIHTFFKRRSITHISLCLYLTLLLLTILLYSIAELLGLGPLRIVAFRVDTLVVSPMPIIILIAAFQLINTGEIRP